MGTLLTLIRHGHTEWNALGRYQGHAPVSLSTRGQAQVRALADALAGDLAGTVLFSSDLLRCRQTAAPLVERLGVTVTVDARFREINYGNWQGMTRQELAVVDAERFEAYRRDPFEVLIPGGESQRMLSERVLAGLTEVLASHQDDHVVLVTHGGPVREVLRRFNLWDGGRPPGNASRTMLAIDAPGKAQMMLYADVSFLPKDLRPDTSGTDFLIQQ